MNRKQKILLAGAAVAAIASVVWVTGHGGHVAVESRAGGTEIGAGEQARLGGDGAAGGEAVPGGRAGEATREERLARTLQQQAQLGQLRARVAELEHQLADGNDKARPWADPGPEQLAKFVAQCKVRFDVPPIEPLSPEAGKDRVAAGELADYQAAMAEVGAQWKELLRSLYVEATGKARAGDDVSTRAILREIEDKGPPGESAMIRERIAQERAGLATPPADLSDTSPLERLWRARMQLGDQAEAALARRLGLERARAIRGEGWDAHHEASGCSRSESDHNDMETVSGPR